MVALPDPDGFTGLFDDAYAAVAEAIYSLGKPRRASIGPSFCPGAPRSSARLILGGTLGGAWYSLNGGRQAGPELLRRR